MNSAPHNLLGLALMSGIRAGLAAANESGARAVLLKSGLEHFSAGADVSLFDEALGRRGRLSASPLAFLRELESFPLPMVAAVQGVCVGGGFELALACDFIISARSARFGSVEATIGLSPLMGARGVEAADAEMENLQVPLWESEDLRTGVESLMKRGPGRAVFKGR